MTQQFVHLSQPALRGVARPLGISIGSLSFGCALLGLAATASGAGADPEGVAFFEKRIRPVLVEWCFKCHSAQSEKLKGNLHLDSREGMLKGGDTRPAVVPSNVEKSLLIEAVRYGNPDLQMPPKGKLTDEQISDLAIWVRLGAPWPADSAASPAAKKDEFNLENRRLAHWAWKPIQVQLPPPVKDHDWPRQPIDRFILRGLEENNLQPAPPAEKRTLIRRLCFDLVGLPPSAREVEDFLRDPSPGAYEKVVDRLLASPRFGERWARHWLDLVRYSETYGHEFDYPRPNTWRYRDYVIRAFNGDLPYDQFVIEHVAGDLLPRPRREPADGSNESVIGTAFYWLGQQTHSPVDVRQHQADTIENQIDVLAKTFLGLTVACARCHDHKFDAISTRDFYALYGMVASSRYAQRAIDAPGLIAVNVERLKTLKQEIRSALAASWLEQSSSIARYLLAGNVLLHGNTQPADENSSGAIASGGSVEAVASAFKLDEKRLARWVTALRDERISKPAHPLYAWSCLAAMNPPESFSDAWEKISLRAEGSAETGPRAHDVLFADFSGGDFADWMADGEAFREALHAAGEIIVGDPAKPVAMFLREPGLNTALWSRRLQGAIRSPTFTVSTRFAHIRAAGRDSRFNIIIDNYTLIQAPIYGDLRRVLDTDDLSWFTVDLGAWQGQRAYLEFSDISPPDPANSGKIGGYGPAGWVELQQVVFSDEKAAPPAPPPPTLPALVGGGPVRSLEELAKAYQGAVASAIHAWATSKLAGAANGNDQAALLAWLVQSGLLEPKGDSSQSQRLTRLMTDYQRIEASIPEPAYVPAMAEGTGLDEVVFIRGNPKTPGDLVPRRSLEALGGCAQAPFKNGSGRLEFARQLTDPSNPFLSRVMVNRVWLHLFGRGIVPTPDDFGVLGQPPSHPELLDWLANYFRTDCQWSAKKLIRTLVTSSAYCMASKPADAVAEEKDPMNLLWHRMPVRRLEGEAIRDSLLALAGRLDEAMYGPSVPMHLTEFMEGRGRPASSGPLDGNGRRSIYLEVRGNFPSPMMRTFDTPVPFTTVGKRTVSNVPAQSLILMNDPFVLSQARLWARRLLQEEGRTAPQRIRDIYQRACNREPSPRELTEAMEFLAAQAAAYGPAEPDRQEKVWTDLCHVMLNVKEFVFIN